VIYHRIQDSQSNGFVAALTHNAEIKMGVLHAAYGDAYDHTINTLLLIL
jgi:hypothetical protein